MQKTGRLSASVRGLWCNALASSLIWIPLSMGVSAHAQSSAQLAEQGAEAQPAPAPVIPQQVRYSGKLASRAGQTVDAVFSIYAVQQDGEPLWNETQRFTVAPDGSYSVLLGSASPGGLPQTVFAAGVARWLGVSVERVPELDRVMLASVPYAMKSADAEALAGHAAADFVTQEQLAQRDAERAAASAPAVVQNTSGAVTGSGTVGAIPLWTGSLTQGNSNMVQVGTDIGINQPKPAATLDVGGTELIRGTLTLPALSTATAAAGERSQLLQLNASAWSTTANAAIAPAFRLLASSIGNDTASPSGIFEFQYGLGTSFANVLSVGSNGALTSNGGVTVTPATAATASAAVNSPPLELSASAWSSGTSKAVAQNFAWRALAAGNNTASPSANLALLYGSGTTTPASTGLSITPKGILNWAPGQTFPGTGTLTGVAAGTGLTGGGISGTPTLAVDPTQVPLLNAQNSFTNTNTFVGTLDSLGTLDLGANGLTSSFAPNLNSALLELSANAYNSSQDAPEALTFGWQSVATGGNTASPSANLELLYGSGSTQPAATGLSIAPSGVITFASGQTFPGGGGGGGIAGITTSSPLTGSGTSGTVNLGLNASALETTLDGVYPQLTAANSFGSTQTIDTSAGTGLSATAYNLISTGVFASGNTYGVSATSAGTGVQGQSTGGGVGVYGAGATGVQAYGTAIGVSSSSSGAGGSAVSSDDTSGTGVGVLGASGTLPAVQAGTGVQGSGPDYGVYGLSLGYEGIGVAGVANQGFGVYGYAPESAGVFGALTTTRSGVFNSYFQNGDIAGIWADSTGFGYGVSALIATADLSNAGIFENNFPAQNTVSIKNDSTGGTGLFKTLMATTPDGVCGFGGAGSLVCTGQLKSLAAAGGGARKVETYSVQSPENWMEDFGTGELHRGFAVVKIDPAFAETVTADASYHVFITPNGDSEALYVINKTATSFEVRESKGGTSSLAFDYRIVARRRGYEAQRLTDVTDRFNAEQAQAMRPRGAGAARKPAGMPESHLDAPPGSHPRRPLPQMPRVPHQPISRPPNPGTEK